MAVKNSTIMAKAWLAGTNDFQQRIPDPTQSGMKATIDALFDPMNKQYWNQFIDVLVNRIGKTIVRGQRWENKLRAFKQDNLMYGNTIQEIAPKWIEAHSYDDADETLLKLERPEAAVWYHSVNRQDRYDISIVDIELRRAFTEEYGLNDFIVKIMDVPYNSDAYDEYLCMKELVAFYENKWGFFKVNTPAIVDEETGKKFLTKARAYAGKLEFPSTLYNAADIDIPVFANQDELILMTTPEIDASLDVNTLSAMFNLDKGELKYRKVIIDEFPIPNAQALLTTRDWFVVHDVVYETTSFYNPKTLGTNYYLHHHEVISCSPFVPAILFTTDAGTETGVITQDVTGLSVTADSTNVELGGEVKINTVLNGTITPETEGIVVSPDAVTYSISAKNGTDPVELNSATYVDRFGVLHVQKSKLKEGSTITVECTSTYQNPSGSTTPYSGSVDITVGFPEPDYENVEIEDVNFNYNSATLDKSKKEISNIEVTTGDTSGVKSILVFNNTEYEATCAAGDFNWGPIYYGDLGAGEYVGKVTSYEGTSSEFIGKSFKLIIPAKY